MSQRALAEVLAELPWAWRQDIAGYASAVQRAAPDIFADAGVRYNRGLLETFVFFAGVRRVWTRVSGQYWLLDNSLSLVAEQDVTAMRVGGRRFQRHGDEHQQLRRLQSHLQELLVELDAWEVVGAPSLADVLRVIAERRDGRRDH